jgi:hypothetical protein
MQLARIAFAPLLGLTCIVVAGLMLGPANGQAPSTGSPADSPATSDDAEPPEKATKVFKLDGPDARLARETLVTLFPDSVALAAAG